MKENELGNDKKSAQKLGQFMTPPEITDRMISMLSPGNQTLTDPAVGSGNILAAAIRAGFKEENLIGYDIDPKAIEFCKQKFPKAKLYLQNFLDEDVQPKSDCSILNPPYFGMIDGKPGKPVWKLFLKKCLGLGETVCLAPNKETPYKDASLEIPDTYNPWGLRIYTYMPKARKNLLGNIKGLSDQKPEGIENVDYLMIPTHDIHARSWLKRGWSDYYLKVYYSVPEKFEEFRKNLGDYFEQVERNKLRIDWKDIFYRTWENKLKFGQV